MKMNKLGKSGTEVSEICLGTMLFGTQTKEEDAWRQIDMAIDHGINILDTAEMYPVNPISADTQGDSERIIGGWVKQSGRRNRIKIATKVTGAGNKIVRNGAPITSGSIRVAVESSLQSLCTDHIDLYQLHWPNRGSYMFRQNWHYNPTQQDTAATLNHMVDVLEEIKRLVDAGKVGLFGLSNESTWGTSQWLRIAAELNHPRVQTLQNEYSLVCRLFDTDLAELAHNENVGLLAYSPLAAGILTGKYQGGAVPKGSRKSISPKLGGRATDRVWHAVDAYKETARRFGYDLAHMALAWCRKRPFMASVIFGATTSKQLQYLLESADLELSQECMAEIDDVHRQHPMPY